VLTAAAEDELFEILGVASDTAALGSSTRIEAVVDGFNTTFVGLPIFLSTLERRDCSTDHDARLASLDKFKVVQTQKRQSHYKDFHFGCSWVRFKSEITSATPNIY
jgi:hypothetical protein